MLLEGGGVLILTSSRVQLLGAVLGVGNWALEPRCGTLAPPLAPGSPTTTLLPPHLQPHEVRMSRGAAVKAGCVLTAGTFFAQPARPARGQAALASLWYPRYVHAMEY